MLNYQRISPTFEQNHVVVGSKTAQHICKLLGTPVCTGSMMYVLAIWTFDEDPWKPIFFQWIMHACMQNSQNMVLNLRNKGFTYVLSPKMSVKKHQNTIFPAKKNIPNICTTTNWQIQNILYHCLGRGNMFVTVRKCETVHPPSAMLHSFFLRPISANPQPSRCRGTRTDTKFGKVSGACNARMKPMFPKLFSAASSQKTSHKGLMAMPYLFLAIGKVFQSTWKLKATNLQTKIASKNHIIKSESAQITAARSLSKSHPSRGFSGCGGIFIEEMGMVLVTQSKRVRNDASGGDWAPDGHLKVISPRRTNPHCDKCFAQGFAWPNCW